MSVKEDLLNTIRALPLMEQQALLDELTAVLNGETKRTGNRIPVSVSEVRGIARPDGSPPPTDVEIADGYADYLIEKYS